MADEPQNTEPFVISAETIKSSGLATKKDIGVEIETQVTKKMTQIATWVISILLASIFGGIITALWNVNGEVRELKGMYSSPDHIIEYSSERIEYLDSVNNIMNQKLHNLELEEKDELIKKLQDNLKKEKNEHKGR